MRSILTKWLFILTAAPLTVLILNACNSNLRVKTQTVTSEGNPNGTNKSDTGSSTPDNGTNNQTDPYGPSLALTITTEDGRVFKENATLNAKKPTVTWSSQNDEIATIKLLIALDAKCEDVLFQFDQNSNTKRSIDFLEDGAYNLCIFGVTTKGVTIPGINNGILLTLDRSPPIINGSKIYFFNHESSPGIEIVDKSQTTQLWTQKSGPGKIAFSEITDLNPRIKATIEGVYIVNVAVIDSAGNSSNQDLVITWDKTPPLFVNLQTANEASDSFINASESSSPLEFASLNASDYIDAKYTNILDANTSVTCDGLLTYANSTVPAISTMGGDGTYALCVKLTDAAGNITYGKSSTVLKDTTAPIVNAGADILTKAQVTSVATVTGATSYSWAQTAGSGTITFGDASALNTTLSASADGAYTLTLTATDAAGNSASDSLNFTWDTTAPVFISLALANEASDSYVNATESASTVTAASLTASGYATANYSALLDDSVAITCDGSKTYSNSSIPAINSLSTDGVYALCVKLSDAAGNISYGKSPQLTRDTSGPVFTSLVGANGASDGYVNSSEYLSTAAMLTLSGSGYSSSLYSAVLASTVTCDGTQTYSNGSIPAISDIPGSDASYAVCVKLSDAASNVTYGKSSTIIRDITPPSLTSLALANGAADGFVNSSESSSAAAVAALTASGYSSANYTNLLDDSVAITCDASKTYSNGNIPAINTLAADGAYALCVKLVDAAGNITYGKSAQVTRNALGPIFTSLLGANGAADGYVNASESSSASVILTLSASNYTAVNYTAILADTVTCDGTQTYGSSSIPAINGLPGSDGNYAVCVKLQDAAANITYGKSQTIVRDTAAPIVTSFVLANGAADGFINSNDSSSSAAAAALTASGYASANYTNLLDDSTPITCDGSKTYGNSTVPAINTLGADGVYALCVKLADAAGNITYGKSPQMTRDTSGPIFTSLVGINNASDGYINNSEYLSTASLLSLSASGYTSANYTTVLVDSALTCDGSKTYSNGSIPLISDIPAADNNYAVCVSLSDVAGNITYGKSQTIVRDITAPVFTSLVAANGASDGYVNSSEAASALAFATLTASGQSITNYTAILVDSPVTCDGSQTYSNGSIPAISTMGADNTYALCVKLADAAGNITYGKSNAVVKDTLAPVVNAGVDILANAQVTSAATVTGATTYAWTKTAGAGTITFGSASAMNTTITASTDAAYTITLTATDAAGNSASDSLIFTWDTTAPTFTSFVGANGASDGYVNASEYLSPASLATLTASNYTTAQYTSVVASTTTCDNSQTYSQGSIPLISDIPGVDASYAICVKLSDTVGNITYGKSSTIVRDITPPIFTSLTNANGASDGYINNSEKSSGSAIMTLTASNYNTVNYSAILDNTPTITCNSGISYPNSSIPAISTMPAADDTYTLCVKLTDLAGNVTYGTGSDVIRDTVAPIVTLSGTPNAYSSAANFDVTVSGTGVDQYKYGVINSTTSVCTSATYSGWVGGATKISSAIGADGPKTLCVAGMDLAGNVQATATYFNFIEIASTPAATSTLSLTVNNTSVSVAWSAVGGSYGSIDSYVVVRGVNIGSTAAWTPTNGTTYVAGNISAGLDIVYAGTNTSYSDTGLSYGNFYEYAVFTVSAASIYSTAKKNKIAYFPLSTHTASDAPQLNIHAQEYAYFNRVALSADGLTLIVGSPGHALDANNANPLKNAGAVFVYSRVNTASSWTLSQKLVGTGTNGRVSGDNFGGAIAISDDGTMVAVTSINSYDENGQNNLLYAGAVYMFQKSGGTWSLQQKVVATGVNGRYSGCGFANDVALTNDTLVVGSKSQSYDETGGNYVGGAGAVFVYRLITGTWSFEQKLIPSGTNARNTNDAFGNAVTIDLDTIGVGTTSHQYDDSGNNPITTGGAVFVFTRSGSTWSQQSKITPSGTNARNANDAFSTDISISGDTLVSSSPFNGYNATGLLATSWRGVTFVFTRTAGVWSQQQRLDSGSIKSGALGWGVSLKGNTVVLGAPWTSKDSAGLNSLSNAGALYIYDRSGSTWSLTQMVSITGTNSRKESDILGQYVALAGTGSTLVSGSLNNFDSTGTSFSISSGSVFTFEKSGTWSQTQKTTENYVVSRSRSSIRYGQEIYISPDGLSLLVAAQFDPTDQNNANANVTGVGAVFYYTRPTTSSSWTYNQKIVPFGTNSRDTPSSYSINFGTRIAVDGTTLVVGAPGDSYDENGTSLMYTAGAVYTYSLSGGVWNNGQKIVASGTNNRYYYDNFGSSLALNGDLMVVGAYLQDYDDTGANILTSAGAAYVFTRAGGVWSQTIKLVETGTNGRSANDYFGYDVATNGTYIAVSAIQNQYDRNGTNIVSNAGLVWIYKNTGTWTLNQIIDQPAGRSATDNFGYSLAMANNTLVIGSPFNRYDENESASGSIAGAAYVFVESAGTFALQQKLVGFGVYGRNGSDYYGKKVAISGDFIAVSAFEQDYDDIGAYVSNAGAVFTYHRSGTTWINGRKNITFDLSGRTLDAPNFGTGLAVAPNILVAGNIFTDFDSATGTTYSLDKGTIYLFTP